MATAEQYFVMIHAVLQCSVWGLKTKPTNINVEQNLENVSIPVHAPNAVISRLAADYSNIISGRRVPLQAYSLPREDLFPRLKVVSSAGSRIPGLAEKGWKSGFLLPSHLFLDNESLFIFCHVPSWSSGWTGTQSADEL